MIMIIIQETEDNEVCRMDIRCDKKSTKSELALLSTITNNLKSMEENKNV